MFEPSNADKIVKLLRRALEGLMKMMGKKHESTATCGIHILELLSNCGRDSEGVKLLKEYGLESTMVSKLESIIAIENHGLN